jgi:hypothetical protein
MKLYLQNINFLIKRERKNFNKVKRSVVLITLTNQQALTIKEIN